MTTLILLLNFLNVVTSISWYRNFGTGVDNSICTIEDVQPIVEYYIIDDYQYMLFSERISWDEAHTICPIYDAQLAVVDTAPKAYKLTTAISESNIDMEDVWIGAQRSDRGNWKWIDDSPLLSEPIDDFPPWVRNPNRPWKQCLGMDRFTIAKPLFVDLDCRLPKPFICQRDVNGPANPDVTLPSHMATVGKNTYVLYHSRVSWGTAAAFCRMRGYRLAVIPNNKISKIVSTAMARSRPSFKHMWIAGHFSRKKWRWLSTGEVIPSFPDQNNYPPWYKTDNHTSGGCVLFDRQLCEDVVFLAAGCDRKRDFICEKYPKQTKAPAELDPIKITYKNWTMILCLKELSWSAAQQYCHNQNSYLTEVYDYDMMKAITSIMSDQESEPTHVWLGGMLINNTWVWIQNNKSIPTTTDETGFLPWCDMEEKGNNDCLNMDREAHDKPSVYGLKCKLKQPFVCTRLPARRKLMIIKAPTITHKMTTSPTRSTRTFTSIRQSATTTTPITTTTTTATTTTTTPTTTTTTLTTTTTTPTTTSTTSTTPRPTPTTTATTTTTTPITTTTTPTTTATTTTTTPITTTTTPTTTATTTTTTLTTTTTTPTTTTTTPTTTAPTLTTTTTTPTTTTTIPSTTTTTITTKTTVSGATTTSVPTTVTTPTTMSTIQTTSKPCEQEPVLTLSVKDKVYVSFFTPITFLDARTICNQAGGNLAKLTVKNSKFLTQQLWERASRCTEGLLWTEHARLNCTYIDYTTGKSRVSTTCSTDEKGCICEIDCSHPTHNYPIFDNNIWNCSNSNKTETCYITCKSGSVLQGVDKLVCTSAGWVDGYNNKTSLLPVCRDEDKTAADLINWLEEFRRRQYKILYVVDESINITTEEWWLQMQFIASLTQVFPASQEFPFGLLMYHRVAKTHIPFNVTDACEVFEHSFLSTPPMRKVQK